MFDQVIALAEEFQRGIGENLEFIVENLDIFSIKARKLAIFRRKHGQKEIIKELLQFHGFREIRRKAQ